jgi:hypothetical protein
MDHDIQKQILGVSLLAMQDALRRTLKELYYLKGADGAKWLDEFEQRLLSDAKGTISDGVSMEDELKAVEGSMQMLRFVFMAVRSEIAETEND